jgi:hypothetical protein
MQPFDLSRVSEGIRTPDPWGHNPVLYPLSYAHHQFLTTPLVIMPEPARPAGIEPATPSLEGSCSIRLSYGRW